MICQSKTHEVSELGKEIFTKVLHNNHGNLAAGVTDRTTLEFVASENMYIIGCSFGKSGATSGGQCITSIARTGVYKEVGSYTADEIFISDDGVLFHWSTLAQDVDLMPLACSELQMLPDGAYFFLEKGERLYKHNSTKNNHPSGALNFGETALLYYCKTKP